MKALVVVAFLMAAQAAFAQTQAPAAGRGGRGGGGAAQATPAAPGPGSPAIYKSAADLLANSNVATTDQYRINIVKREQGATPLTHAGNTELHYIISGSATVVTGGKVVRPANGGAADVEGGVTRKVGKGDVIVVPADTVHWYKDVQEPITYLEVRFVVPTK